MHNRAIHFTRMDHVSIVGAWKRGAMPSTVQSPLERHRDVQRRWGRLLERTLAPKHDSAILTILPPTNHFHAEAESVQVTELPQPRRVERSPARA
jgi:hypothetical protein